MSTAAENEPDPRSPIARLQALFDPQTLEIITPVDDRGVIVGVGRLDGAGSGSPPSTR